MMIMGIAVFLTFFIMEPTLTKSWEEGLSPYMDGAITAEQATERTLEPFEEFMSRRVDVPTLERLAATMPERGYDAQDPSFTLLATGFMLSEIKRGISDLALSIFLPFLVIDLIVASILMAMGMMMVPPAVVSLPFKLGFIVLADGWLKITEALLAGYV